MGPLIFSTEASVLTSRGDWRSGAALSAILLIAISSRGSLFAALRLSCQYSRDPMWHIPAGGGGVVCVANTRVSSYQAVLSSAFSGTVLLNGEGLHSKVKDTVLFGPKLNVQYSLFIRQTDESVWLRKVETWLLYCVFTVFSQSYLRSKVLVQSFIPFKFQPVLTFFIKIKMIVLIFKHKKLC